MSPTFSKIRIALVIVLVAAGVVVAMRVRQGEEKSEEANRKVSEEAIRKVLDDQVEAWNRGDLEGFMQGYWKSDELTFFSGGNVRRGWDETYDRYRKKYKGSPREPVQSPLNLVALPLSGYGLAPGGSLLGAAAQQLSTLALLETDALTPEMGTLQFEKYQITLTGPMTALVRGRWGLTFPAREPVGGLFTLLFRKEAQGWCIVHDHTS
jgi:ketosteroid isomerase-like protein